MFDTAFPGIAELAEADDSLVVAAITGWAQIEAAASARRLAAIAELVARRVDGGSVRAHWACDDWDATAAEVAAALNVSHGKASAQMHLGEALRERLPRVAAAFADGVLGAAVVAMIAWHTTLINDPDALALVDAALAKDALDYGALSVTKTGQAIDAIVDEHDPGALRRTRATARSRDLVIDKADSQTGTTALWGRLYAADAELLDRRLMAMAHQLCDDDPRTIAQRRADALGVLAAGGDRLACGCGAGDCPAAHTTGGPNRVTIHVVTDQAALASSPDAHHNGEDPPARKLHLDMPLDEVPARPPEPDPPAVTAPPALILGGPLIPAPLLAQLIDTGATIRPVRHPGSASPAEPHYRPSTALDEFIRCRDLTCRFPGCDRPAEHCDIDHRIPYRDGGPTHPSSLRCLCRKHHLLKTFWNWSDTQHPDGTIEWTSPSGQTYTTHPGSRLLFPSLCQPTGAPPPPTPTQQSRADRTLMMPTRRRTRTQNRTHHINTERARNAEHVAERNRPPPF